MGAGVQRWGKKRSKRRFIHPAVLADKAKAKAAGALCDSCPLVGERCVPPKGKVTSAKMALVGRWPGDDELTERRHHVGRTGNKIKSTLEFFDIPVSEVHLTNMLLCKPAGKLPKGGLKMALDACLPRVWRELAATRAVVVIAADKYALRGLAGKNSAKDWMGVRLEPVGHPEGYAPAVIGTIQPAEGFHKPAWWPVFYTHITRAWSWVQGTAVAWKWPRIVCITHDYPEEKAIAALEMVLRERQLVAVDVETGGIDPQTAPLTEIGFGTAKIGVSIHRFAFKKYARLIRQILESDTPKGMQNGNFDMAVLRRRGYTVNNYRWDSLYLHRIFAPDLIHKLGFILQTLFDLPAWKAKFHLGSDEKGSKKWEDDVPDETDEKKRAKLEKKILETRKARMTYNAQDCVATRRGIIELCRRMNIDWSHANDQ